MHLPDNYPPSLCDPTAILRVDFYGNKLERRGNKVFVGYRLCSVDFLILINSEPVSRHNTLEEVANSLRLYCLILKVVK